MGETDEALHGAGDEERTMVQGGENRGKTDIGKRLTRGGQMWYATLDARENNIMKPSAENRQTQGGDER